MRGTHPFTLDLSAPFLSLKVAMDSKCSVQLHRGHQNNPREVVDCSNSLVLLEWLTAKGIKGIKGLTLLSCDLAGDHFFYYQQQTCIESCHDNKASLQTREHSKQMETYRDDIVVLNYNRDNSIDSSQKDIVNNDQLIVAETLKINQ